MCRRAERSFAPSATSVGEARRFVGGLARRWGIAALADDLSVPLSEIVTNAVLHAHTALTVGFAVSKRAVEVDVRDGDVRAPILRPVRPDVLGDLDSLDSRLPLAALESVDPRHPALHSGAGGSVFAGRGMLIVDALADEWGVAQYAAGKDVWFALATPPAWGYRSLCMCGPTSEAPPLASRHRVLHLSGEWDAEP